MASLTRQFIVTLTGGAAVLWLAAAGATAIILQHELAETLDSALLQTADRLLPLALESLDRSEPGRHRSGDDDERGGFEVAANDDRADDYIVYQVRDQGGRVLLRSHGAPPEGLAPLVPGFADIDGRRVFTLASGREPLSIQVAEAAGQRAQALTGSAIALLLPLLVLLPLAAGGIAFGVRRGLRPVTQLSVEIAARHAGNLAHLDTSALPAELRPMASAVEDLLGRVKVALDAERAFAANSAHELRTPIAGSLAQAQRLIDELRGRPGAERAQAVVDSLKRLQGLAEKLLQLARVDSGMARAEREADLLPAVAAVVEDARRRAGSADRINLERLGAGRLVARIDVDAFGIALRNLIDNALLHGEAGGVVRITVGDGTVTVSNRGEVVPPKVLKTLTQRFVRGATLADGSGLGLALVNSIMEQVGGRLDISSPAAGQSDGFSAQLLFS